jgi:hypothetical protein
MRVKKNLVEAMMRREIGIAQSKSTHTQMATEINVTNGCLISVNMFTQKKEPCLQSRWNIWLLQDVAYVYGITRNHD